MAINYADYFKPDQQVKGVVTLTDGTFLTVNGQIKKMSKDLLTLELFGTSSSRNQSVDVGNGVDLAITTPWSTYRCKGVVAQDQQQRDIIVRLVGQVHDKQKREYFRQDVVLSFSFSIPKQQTLALLKAEWSVARATTRALPSPDMKQGNLVKWQNMTNLDQMQVNLSADGMSFLNANYIAPKTLLFIYLFLPHPIPQVIPIVAELLRCKEIPITRLNKSNYSCAIQMRLIHEKDREAIVSFLFAEQRRQRKISEGVAL